MQPMEIIHFIVKFPNSAAGQSKGEGHTPRRKLEHLVRAVSGRDTFSVRWSKDFIESVCVKQNLRCSFDGALENMHASLYRFNVRIS